MAAPAANEAQPQGPQVPRAPSVQCGPGHSSRTTSGTTYSRRQRA